MAVFPLHGSLFFRHFRRANIMSVYVTVLVLYFHSVSCATISNSSEILYSKDSEGHNLENKTFSHRRLLSDQHILASNPLNPYIHTPSLGFPIYQNLQHFTPPKPLLQTQTTSTNGGSHASVVSQKKRPKVKAKLTSEDEIPKVSIDDQEDEIKETTVATTKIKRKKDKRKKEKLQKELEKVQSKIAVDEGSERGCPACVAGTCDSLLDPSTNISGIPVIQIIIALAIGAIWALIFAFVLHNFVEYKEEGGGYGYGASPAPQYGTPTVHYGAPVSQYGAPQSEYGAPHGHSNYKRISYGRSSQGFTFDDLSNRVWDAIDKFISKYDN